MKLTKNDRDFVRVVEFATALSLALMTGFLVSIKHVNPSLEFQFNAWVVISFLISAAIAWLACHLFFRSITTDVPAESSLNRKRLLLRWVIIFCAGIFLETLLAVAHSLRGIPSEKLREVIEGALWAVLVLSLTAALFWRLTRFFGAEESGNPPHQP
ncbi:MAG TPA: hypothetical protein VGE41_13640 [Verrucomicrobiae bacterium]